MSQISLYLDAAERANTRRSYASAIQHFEMWGGLLPATIDSIARYLTAYAESLSLNTLKHRLAALSRWHQDYGFPDPTKAPKIRQLLKGIRTLHPAQEKRAKPLELEVLRDVTDWLTSAITTAVSHGDLTSALRHTRDRALVLLGFWRGFRSDELVNLRIEFIEIKPNEGLSCFLPRSKGDRNLEGRSYSCPALSRLCPVEAVGDWLTLSKLTAGPLFRRIDRWGHLSEAELTPSSIIPMLRKLLNRAGVADAAAFSSHSLRRGFAQWAGVSGWDIRELMNYVGWRDVKAAIRYLDGVSLDQKARFEQGLDQVFPEKLSVAPLQLPSQPETAYTMIEVSINLSAFNGSRRCVANALRDMTNSCLARFQAQPLDQDGRRYRISVPTPSINILDDHLYVLLDELHRIADTRECFLEAVCCDPATGRHWD
jgi:integrase